MTPPVVLVIKGLDLGGMERVVTDLAIGLHRRGVEVAVVVINAERDQLVAALTDAGVPVHLLHGSDAVGLAGLRAVRQLRRSNPHAVFHAHGPLPIVASVLASPRAPIIASFHTTWPALRRSSRSLLRLVLPHCRTLVAVSHAVRATLPRTARCRSVVVGHGIDPAACAAARVAAVADADSASRGRVRLVTVASHRPVKNYDNLLRAVAIVNAATPVVQLLAIGDGPRLAAHRSLAADLGIADAVTFRPATPTVLADIAAADIFVLASDLEGQPMVLLEAMATGRPVIATTVGRAPELITGANGRLVPPGDPALLAAAIGELAGDAGLRRRLGAAAAAAIADHTIERAVSEHLALYAETASA